ncbi:MAG: AI-2E family transporter [Clostridia bacterium]|nr:AI-2E family transporter [Clostridia bacterium]
MDENKLRRLAYLTVVSFGGIALVYLFFKNVFAVLLPLLIAWAIAFITRPIAEAIGRRVRIPRGVLRAIFALLITVTVIGAISLLVYAVAHELWLLLSGFGDGEGLRALIDKLVSGGFLGGILDSLGERIADVFYELVISVVSGLGSAITGVLGAIPGTLLFILVTVIASVYFALDLERINSLVLRILPAKGAEWLKRFKTGLFSVGLKYIGSYLILMLITFVIMLVGLLIIGAPYALLLAFIIALFDLLPVIGVGTILIPWGLFELAVGSGALGVGLLVLFCIYQVIRQLAEPRIIGRNLGVHPLLTLTLLYIGYSLFGFSGILVVPIVSVLIEISFNKKDSAEVGEGGVT